MQKVLVQNLCDVCWNQDRVEDTATESLEYQYKGERYAIDLCAEHWITVPPVELIKEGRQAKPKRYGNSHGSKVVLTGPETGLTSEQVSIRTRNTKGIPRLRIPCPECGIEMPAYGGMSLHVNAKHPTFDKSVLKEYSRTQVAKLQFENGEHDD